MVVGINVESVAMTNTATMKNIGRNSIWKSVDYAIYKERSLLVLGAKAKSARLFGSIAKHLIIVFFVTVSAKKKRDSRHKRKVAIKMACEFPQFSILQPMWKVTVLSAFLHFLSSINVSTF